MAIGLASSICLITGLVLSFQSLRSGNSQLERCATFLIRLGANGTIAFFLILFITSGTDIVDKEMLIWFIPCAIIFILGAKPVRSRLHLERLRNLYFSSLFLGVYFFFLFIKRPSTSSLLGPVTVGVIYGLVFAYTLMKVFRQKLAVGRVRTLWVTLGIGQLVIGIIFIAASLFFFTGSESRTIMAGLCVPIAVPAFLVSSSIFSLLEVRTLERDFKRRLTVSDLHCSKPVSGSQKV